MLKTRLLNKNEQFFVAEKDNVILGVIMLKTELLPDVVPYSKRGYIAETFILEKYRSQGIGKQLVEKSIAFFKENDCDVLELQVSVQNPKGLEFWKRMGFTIGTHHLIKPLDI